MSFRGGFPRPEREGIDGNGRIVMTELRLVPDPGLGRDVQTTDISADNTHTTATSTEPKAIHHLPWI
jgi:hypothetical protein